MAAAAKWRDRGNVSRSHKILFMCEVKNFDNFIHTRDLFFECVE